jgi:hypothetical protein
MVRRLHRGERGQALPVVLALVTLLFLLGSALAAHASTALRAGVAGEAEADDLYAADAGLELGIWWQRNGQAGDPPPQTTNGRSVTTTVATAGGAPCPTISPMRLTGFEHGSASATGAGVFDTVNGATADAGVARSGGYSLQVADTSITTARSASWNGNASPLVARFAIRLASLPAANVAELATFEAAAGSRLRLGYAAASNRFVLQIGAGTIVSASSAVSARAWYVIDLRFSVGTSPRTADWRIDGTAQPQASLSEAAAANVTVVRLGSTVAADAFTANYDDVILSSVTADYPIGAGAVLALRPDGAGAHVGAANFQNDDGTAVNATSPGRLSDDPMTSSATFVRQTTVSTTSYLELTIEDTAATCISGVSAVLAYHAANASGNDGRTSILVGATERVVYVGDMARTQLTYRSAVIVPPTSPWTTTAVNGLRARVGSSNDVIPAPSWEALLLEYATAPAAPGTVTITATAGDSTVTTRYTDVGSGTPVLDSWTTTR